MRSFRRIPLALGAGALIAVFTVQTASAHVEIDEAEVTAGSEAILTFSVPHGCDGSATTELRIQMPESIPEVTPTRNANWTASKVTEALDTPITDPEGAQFTERVSEVVYTAITPLPDGYRDVFELAVNIPDDAAGTRLYFPTIQTCEVGETAWIELPAEGQDPEELEHPAPSVMVVAPPTDATDAAHTADSTASTDA